MQKWLREGTAQEGKSNLPPEDAGRRTQHGREEKRISGPKKKASGACYRGNDRKSGRRRNEDIV